MADVIIGRQPVLEILKAGAPVEKIFLLRGTLGKSAQSIRVLAKRSGVPVVEVDANRLREISPSEHTQGVVALVGSKAYVEPAEILGIARKKSEQPFLVILDEIEDTHNLGALIRSADGSGAHGVIIPKHHAATINETVSKTSAGATAHMPIARVTNIAQTIEELKGQGLWIVGTEMSASQPYDSVDYRGPVAIVIGNEGKGIRRLVKEKCDFLVRIPMYGKIDSLNASVAGALLMFEVARARHRTDEAKRA